MANRSERGFTLIELLVVIGIIAALAAVVIPNVARFAGSGDASANAADAQTVQSAMDIMMTNNASETVTAGATDATNNFDTLPAAPEALSPLYLRQLPKCFYSWDSSGIVTQTSCP